MIHPLRGATALLASGAVVVLLAAHPAAAQSSASTYSYGTYNPVQAAINRNSMNAAIIKQATGHSATTSRHATKKVTQRRR